MKFLLSYTLPCDDWVQACRLLTVALGTMLMYVAVTEAKTLETDRTLVFLSLGLIAAAQEGQQYLIHARFLVWRLPVFLLLVVACSWRARKISRGQRK